MTDQPKTANEHLAAHRNAVAQLAAQAGIPPEIAHTAPENTSAVAFQHWHDNVHRRNDPDPNDKRTAPDGLPIYELGDPEAPYGFSAHGGGYLIVRPPGEDPSA